MPDISDVNLDDIEEDDFELIPAGWYRCIVSASEMKDTKDGQGQYLALTHTLLDKPEGRLVWNNLNLVNRNEKAVQIAKKQLKALKAACGKPHAKASEELHDIPIMAKVGVQAAKGDYEASNSVKGYKAVEVAAAPIASPSPVGRPWGQ